MDSSSAWMHRQLAGTDPYFGSVLYMKPSLFSYSLMIVIAFIIFFEVCQHHVEALARDSKFARNVKDIQAELMIVGCTAFFFKVLIFNTDFLSDDWFHSIEVAGIVMSLYIHTHLIYIYTRLNCASLTISSHTPHLLIHLIIQTL